LFYPKIKTMLKTQVLKAIYLCLSCFLVSSFSPVSPVTPEKPSISLTKEKAVVPIAPKVKLNRQALQFANRYINTCVESLIKIRQKSRMPFNIMDSVFARHGLPVELKYLAVIESELNTSALSGVGALGPWQLMPETAHELGLKITGRYDERTNYYKSTKAAALYLKDLYAQFGDWLLVLAAYNAGPGPVCAAIQKSGSRNFWALQNFLPAETRGHVKRFIATEYFFEGHGSITTLTKAENIAYAKTLAAYASARSTPAAAFASARSTPATAKGLQQTMLAAPKEQESKASNPIVPLPNATAATVAGNIIGAMNHAPSDNEKTAKEKESTDDRFKRLMRESAKSLQDANKAIEPTSSVS
jgi:hypothetical protein